MLSSCFFNVAAFAVLILTTITSEAYETGAGGCAGGYAAVGGSHYLGNITTGPLSFAGFVVTLDGQTLSQANPTNLTIGQSHVLTLSRPSSYFKGVLFRLGGGPDGVDTTKSLAVRSGDSFLRLASDTCIPLGVGGVTHSSSDEKTSSSVSLRLDKVASKLPLDITVVLQNDEGISTFYYSGFMVNAVAGTGSSPSKAPSTPTRIPRRPIKRPSRPSAPAAPATRPTRRRPAPTRSPV